MVKIPKLLLIGAGKFGKKHLFEWQRLANEGEVILTGIVVITARSQRRIENETEIPVFNELTSDLLQDVDGVDIVTPSTTHYELAKKCLGFTNVLVEKPVVTEPDLAVELQQLADQHGRILMVGHVYRFHPLVRELKNLISKFEKLPKQITGVLTNPPEPGIQNLDPRLEFIHLFDIIDYLFGQSPSFCVGVQKDGVNRISLRYPGPVNAVIDIGWRGNNKERKLSLLYDDQQLDCNFSDNTIVINKPDCQRKIFLDNQPQALRNELKTFLSAIKTGHSDYPGARTGRRVVDIAVCSKPAPLKGRPRVAVIGGGIFGTTCAIELGKTCDVTVFERHHELMSEASFANQWRHHSGFHYPRSPLTVDEVKESRDAFVKQYGKAVLSDIPCYYGTSAFAKEITAERYIAICKSNGLNFEIASPPPGIINPDNLGVCIKTDEAVLDYYALKAQIERQLQESPHITMLCDTEVISGRFGPGGEKCLSYVKDKEVQKGEYDFLINATYGNRNRIAAWFNFQTLPIRYDLLEMLVLEIDIPPFAMTILDGPFTSLTSMGYDNLFMLSHINESILESVVRWDEPPINRSMLQSNRTNLLKHGLKYLPVLERATIVESRYGLRAVYAKSQDFDGRPTVVTDHGFGCWSVLGGKIITCVSNAQEIAKEIKFAVGTGHSNKTEDMQKSHDFL